MPIHILNGDALASKFPLDEPVIIFRECLIEGPKSSPNLSDFWTDRAKYITQAFDTTPVEYHENVVRELSRLSDTGEEICCWFEFDLFCQVNLWFVIHYIDRFIKHSTVSIVQPDPLRDMQWKGFGFLDAGQLLERYVNRTKADQSELRLATALWDAYRKDDFRMLQDLSKHKSPCFPKLEEVINAHRQRFPKKGYGRPKQKLLDIKGRGITQFEKIFSAFQETESIYGFGDTQVKRMLEELHLLP